MNHTKDTETAISDFVKLAYERVVPNFSIILKTEIGRKSLRSAHFKV